MARWLSIALLFSSWAAARELTPPPQLNEPPPWLPYYVTPGPSPTAIESLEHRGRHNEQLGGILMAAGGTVALLGTGLWIAGDWEEHCSGTFSHHHDDHGCGSSVMSISGATLAFAGTAVFVPGLILLINGSHDVAHARALRYRFWGPVSLQPAVGPNGGGVSLRLTH